MARPPVRKNSWGSAHHIMCGGYDRNRIRIGSALANFIAISRMPGSRVLINPPQMIELQQQMVRISATSSSLLYFRGQRARHDIATRQILRVGA